MSASVAPLPDEGDPRVAEGGLRPVASAQAATRLDRVHAGAIIATLVGLVVLNVPDLGLQGWSFRPGSVEPTGIFAPLVRAAGNEWDLGLLRAPVFLAGLLIALAGARAWRASEWRPRVGVALVFAVVALLVVPAVLLQVGLRDATAPWFFTNDATYEIELAGDLVLDGENPYGHDYGRSGLERFYSLDGTARSPDRHPALSHLAYFPGTPLSAAGWRILPTPLDDYRLFVLLATLACLAAVLVFDAPLTWRLAIGAAVAANPLAVRAAWFGTADAPSLAFLLLAFALVTRSRYVWAAASLGVAVLLKQFALVAVPFFVVLLVTSRVGRPALARSAAAFVAVVAAGFLPFLIADAGALWNDTVGYGTGLYPIMGYGLAPLLVRAGILEGAAAPYPFALVALVVWLPVTAWLVWNQVRSRAPWVGAVGFAVSVFLLLFLARVFQPSYLVWPLVGVAIAALLAARALPSRRLGV